MKHPFVLLLSLLAGFAFSCKRAQPTPEDFWKWFQSNEDRLFSFENNREQTFDMTILVSGPMSLRELTEIADKQVRRAIQRVDGVGSVRLNGGQARQIRVLLDAQKVASHNFTVLDVREALQRENIEAPGGRMNIP